jgi:Zn-dependent peptidase ImmA (M78 family)/DNA-binding XRE family transcriptional regulator
MPKRHPDANINPTVLKWARESAGWTIDDIAGKLHADVTLVRGWETGKVQPSLTNLMQLAAYFKRPLAALLLPSPPPEPPLPIDFRQLPRNEQTLSKETRFAIRRARRLRKIALDLIRDFEGDARPKLRKVSITERPETIAQQERERLGIDLKRQLTSKTPFRMFEIWRAALEARNILVFRFPMPIEDTRGFSIVETTLPVIVVSAADAIHARMFTLFHEYGHLLLHEPGICVPGETRATRSHRSRVEIWCNRFAGAFLLPADALAEDAAFLAYQNGDWALGDAAAKLSRRYKVSAQVVVRRMHTAGLIDDETFQREAQLLLARVPVTKLVEKKKKIVIQPERKCLQEQGRRYVGLVLEGGHRQIISFGDVADYLSLSLRHLEKLQALMGG